MNPVTLTREINRLVRSGNVDTSNLCTRANTDYCPEEGNLFINLYFDGFATRVLIYVYVVLGRTSLYMSKETSVLDDAFVKPRSWRRGKHPRLFWSLKDTISQVNYGCEYRGGDDHMAQVITDVLLNWGLDLTRNLVLRKEIKKVL